jgi:hypothetical protein
VHHMSTHLRTSAHTHFRDTHPFATAATQMATGMTGRAAVAAAAATYKTTGLHQTEACMNGTQHSAPPRFRLCLSSDFLSTTTRPLLSGPIMSNTLRGSRPQSRQSLPVARAVKLPTGVTTTLSTIHVFIELDLRFLNTHGMEKPVSKQNE